MIVPSTFPAGQLDFINFGKQFALTKTFRGPINACQFDFPKIEQLKAPVLK